MSQRNSQLTSSLLLRGTSSFVPSIAGYLPLYLLCPTEGKGGLLLSCFLFSKNSFSEVVALFNMVNSVHEQCPLLHRRRLAFNPSFILNKSSHFFFLNRIKLSGQFICAYTDNYLYRSNPLKTGLIHIHEGAMLEPSI